MKSKFYSHLLLLFILLTTTNAKWTRIIYDPTNVHLNSMDIYSENMMVMVGDAGLVRVSTDTGMKNIQNFFIPDQVALLSVACLDNSSIIIGAENGNLYRTSNLGTDWKIMTIESGTPITELKFINSQIGLLSLDNGSIKRTADGGETWEEVYTPDEKPINDIFYKTGGDIWIAGKGKLLISKDMGLTWENRLSSIPGSNGMTNIYRISAPSRDTIFTLSDFLSFYYSYDAGQSWNNITIDQSAMYKFTDPRFAGFEFFNGSLGIIRINDVSLSLLYYEFITTDGGKSFKTIRYKFSDDNIGESMRGIKFLDENIGYSYGGNGEIMKISIVTDSIPHFRYDSMSDAFVPSFSHVASNSGNRVALISDNGIYKYLWLSTNGGFDWKKVNLMHTNSIMKLHQS